MATATCPRCGKTAREWTGHQGRGYAQAGQTYCCEGCARNTGCTCSRGTGPQRAERPQPSSQAAAFDEQDQDLEMQDR